MAEVLVQFDEPHHDTNGAEYIAQVWGRRLADGLWEAWIEFVPADGGEPVRTPRETEQLSRGDLRYWAAGLSRAYLDEALQRAMHPDTVGMYRTGTHPIPVFELLRDSEQTVLDPSALARPMAVLDPVALYQQSGGYALRQELRALDAQQLDDIIAAFAIPEIDTIDIARTFEDALAEQIVAGVQQRVGARHTYGEQTKRLSNVV